jgi:type III secretion protein V
MSIDADMRAGIINYDQARVKRDMLARESQFYGAMDGAMKFVKGDAIAGIVITLINIVAGLIIGVAMQGMEAGEAAQVYSVLTIGSGLVSQIPALLISIAAGIVTTRSGSGADSADSNLGSQVVGQLIAQPKAITLAAGLVFILALVPGLPKVPFFLLSITVGFAGWKLLNPPPSKAETELDEEIAVGPEQEAADPFKHAVKGSGELPMVQPTVPLAVRVGKGLFPLLRDFQKQWGELAAARFFDLGVPFPPVPIAVGNDLGDDAFEVRLNETPALSGNIRLDCHLVPESPLPLASFRIDGVEGRNPLNGRQASWIPSGQAPQAAAAGFTTWDSVGVLKLHLTSFLRRNAAEFLGLQQVHEMVEGMRAHYPNLVEQTVPKPVPVHLLAEVLRGLVREQVSIRDMRTIFESLAQHGRSEQDVEELVEWVRRDLRQRLCHQLSSGGPTLLVTGLSTRFAEGFRLSIRRGPSGSTINLPHKMLEEFLAAARRAFGNLPSTAQVPVLVCDLDIRVWVRRMLSSQFPEVSVVAYEQLSPKLSITMLRELD